MYQRIDMDQLYRSSSNRHALFISDTQFPRSECKQWTHALSPAQNAIPHRVMQALRSNGCGRKQDLQGIFYAYLTASRPILEISDHQYRMGRNFLVHQPLEDAPGVVHPVM